MVFSAVKEKCALVGGFIFAVRRVVHGHTYIKFACAKQAKDAHSYLDNK
jgi:hypothetical protein